MKIAILAWGSPVWDVGILALDSSWKEDGPEIPLELCRLSGGRRLTLAVHVGAKPVPVHWAVSAYDDLVKAAKNLREREKTFPEHVHYVGADGESHKNCEDAVRASVQRWLSGRQELAAAVWNGLQSNWETRRGQPFEIAAAIDYLRDLERKGLEENAREYLVNLPLGCRTEAWRQIVAALGWSC